MIQKIFSKIKGFLSKNNKVLNWNEFVARSDAIGGLNFMSETTEKSYLNKIKRGGLIRPSKIFSMEVN